MIYFAKFAKKNDLQKEEDEVRNGNVSFVYDLGRYCEFRILQYFPLSVRTTLTTWTTWTNGPRGQFGHPAPPRPL